MPRLVYTHVDGSHPGGSYQAAGWARIGTTSGRRCAEGLPKQVFVQALQPDWKRWLCAEPSVRFRPVVDIAMDDEVHWTDLEYGRSTHPDGRMAKRILLMGRAWDESSADELPRYGLQRSRNAIIQGEVIKIHPACTLAGVPVPRSVMSAFRRYRHLNPWGSQAVFRCAT